MKKRYSHATLAKALVQNRLPNKFTISVRDEFYKVLRQNGVKINKKNVSMTQSELVMALHTFLANLNSTITLGVSFELNSKCETGGSLPEMPDCDA